MANRENVLAAIDAVSAGGRSSVSDFDSDLSLGFGASNAVRSSDADARSAGTLARALRSPEMQEALRVHLEAPSEAKLSIERDEETGRMVMKLIDPKTQTVIRQMPPEAMLKIAEAMERYLGLLVDKKS